MMARSQGGAPQTGTRVFIFTTYPTNDAGRRLRIQPLVREFSRNGFHVTVDEIFTNRAYDWKNNGGLKRACSALIVLANLVKRFLVVLMLPKAEVVLIQREAFPFFTPLFERLAVRKAKISVLDVDDAIYCQVTHGRDWRRYFRDPREALKFSALFDVILCGNYELMRVYGSNRALALYAPTCPERAVHDIAGRQKPIKHDFVWIGSQSTLSSLFIYLPGIKAVLRSKSARLLILGGNNVSTIETDANIDVALWSPERELDALRSSRIGIMPLPDTEWERGKSGYKAIMYLCSGLVAVVSPIGFNEVLCEKYGAVPCLNDEWTAVLEVVLTEWEPVPEVQLAAIRSDFDPDRVAAEIYKAIVAKFEAMYGNGIG